MSFTACLLRRCNDWWYKFFFHGELIRQSTRQRNKRVAEQMEAAHKTALAEGEIGTRDKKPVPTLAEFAKGTSCPFFKSTFKARVKTLRYYTNGVDQLLDYEALARERLDNISSDKISAYVATRQRKGLKSLASTANCRSCVSCFTLPKSGAGSRMCSRE